MAKKTKKIALLDATFDAAAKTAAANPTPTLPTTIIDAHCHVFAAPDLPVVTFIAKVILSGWDSGLVNLLIGLLREYLAGRAPPAEIERRQLEGHATRLIERIAALQPTKDREAEDTRNWLVGRLAALFPDGHPSLAMPAVPPAQAPTLASLQHDVVMTLQAHNIDPVAMADRHVAPQLHQAMADRMISDLPGLGEAFTWAKKFGRPRLDNIAELAGFYTADGKTKVFLAPAMVDFNYWLTPPEGGLFTPTNGGSSPQDQVNVMAALAKQRGPVRTHGYVAFDPVRAILASVDQDGPYTEFEGVARWGGDAFKRVEEAVFEKGCLGVKLYPPMGFRAIGNGVGAVTFPDAVKKTVQVIDSASGKRRPSTDTELGGMLDDYLMRLYRFCARNDVAILAHATNSNGSAPGYENRASPTYWADTVERIGKDPQMGGKQLRLCLAHFGHFRAHDPGVACMDRSWDKKAWEVITGQMLKSKAGGLVFADMAYLQEVLATDAAGRDCRAKLRELLKIFFATYPIAYDHIVYGSDWSMLGLEKGHQEYHLRMAEFLASCDFSDTQLAKFFQGNAMRMFGLNPGDPARQRLDTFYGKYGIEADFPFADPLVA